MDSNRIKQRKLYLDQQEEVKKKFSDELGFMINCLWSRNKKDADILQIKDQYSVIRKENTTVIIEGAGPYIWKYREQISKSNVNFFLASDFKDELAVASASQIPEMTSFEDLPAILTKIKRTWHLFSPEEQEILKNKSKSLLSAYAGYISAGKELEKLK